MHTLDDTVELVPGMHRVASLFVSQVVTTVPAEEQQDDRPASAAERALAPPCR
jgi:hypothetical protein